ncbi:MAG: hypothetical protein SPF21_02095, partial [Candidatus Methanomethylophilaceae archaeon]|nr:hypothetical protein [Candidatus Methanomethylophilaceae archaeon]
IEIPDFEFLSLSYLLQTYGEDVIQEGLRFFTCKRDHDREDYLHNKAIMMEKKSISRTYLALTSGGSILGYFSIGMKCMRIPDNTSISNTTRKRMNIDEETGVAQSYLLGQLGRDDQSPKGFGKELLSEALRRLMDANRIVGCRMVRLDCTDELIPYYESNGFVKVSKNERENLNQMVILI